MSDRDHLGRLLHAVLAATEADQARLDRLDAIAGDGDHGATMVIGWRAAAKAISPPAGRGIARRLRDAGAAFADVGGSIGPLWGTALLRAGRTLESREPCLESVARAMEAAVAGVSEIGRSQEGDKTLLDVLGPTVRAFAAGAAAGHDPRAVVGEACEVAQRAAAATADMSPRRGRASRAAARSVGHEDPGAASAALVWSAVRKTL